MEMHWDRVKIKIEATAASILGVVTNINQWEDRFKQYEEFLAKQGGLPEPEKKLASSDSGLHITFVDPRRQAALQTQAGLRSN